MVQREARMRRHLQNRLFIPLRYRFIIVLSLLLLLLLGTLGVILAGYQREIFQSQLERRGLVMAQSLAATSKAALATYNYIALDQSANQAKQEDPDVLFVIIHNKEGHVAGYSGRPDLLGSVLDDDLTVASLGMTEPAVLKSTLSDGDVPIVQAVVPVFIPGSQHRWGTVRVALSLVPVYLQIRRMQWLIAGVGVVALLSGTLISLWAARRITKPLARLVEATVEAAKGNLAQEIEVSTGDEVEILAGNFSSMIQEILAQRQQLERQLFEIRHLQQYTQKLLTTMNDGLLSVDRGGRLAAINPAAQAMLGLSSEVGRGWHAVEVLQERPEVLSYVEEVKKSGSSVGQRELRVRWAEEDRVILASSSLLTDDRGEPVEIIANLHDITELKRLEARMRQAERLAALGTLAAGMAHEIRNPLSAVKTFVQLLPRKLDRVDFLEKFNRTVPRELDRINRLIEDLLELSRTPKYCFQPVRLEQLLAEALEVFEEEMRHRGIDWTTRFEDGLPAVHVDPHQMHKAFGNLIRNAIQAMPDGGKLEIEAHRGRVDLPGSRPENPMDGWVALSFADSGVGIAAGTLRNVFNPFFTTKDTGTGLGLAITHKVITEHGGQIDVVSREGEGSRFVLYLPATRPQAAPTLH